MESILDDAEADVDKQGDTPVPSPTNGHTVCDDNYCPQHENCYVLNSNQSNFEPSPSVSSYKKCRNRYKNYENWQDVKRKKLVNLGKSYVSKRGSFVSERKLGPACKCKVLKCYEKFTNEQRSELHSKFWKLGTKKEQWLFLVRYTTKNNKKRITNLNHVLHNRTFTFEYFLPNSKELIKVCKTMFLNTYDISERPVKTAWEKYDGTTNIISDLRGKHKNRKIIITKNIIDAVIQHVNSFAPIEAHYVRKSSSKIYLDGSLTFRTMHAEFLKLECNLEYNNITARQYKDIVKKNFNLSFFKPKKDRCADCHKFESSLEHTDEEKLNHSLHVARKNKSREMKQADKQAAKTSNKSIIAATFDFQKILTCPHGEVSVLYYSRKLSCFNFTVYDLATKKGSCYMWDEMTAKRGANEVSSCLMNFIEKHVKNGAKNFKFWSDNCAGQNRNRIVFSAYMYAAKKFKISITHTFLEKGHTQNEGDSVHSLIEKSARHKIIYTPSEWKFLVRWAKVEDPYEVVEMTSDDILNYSNLISADTTKKWEKNSQNQKIKWRNIRVVCVEASHPNILLYKYDYDDEFQKLVQPVTRRSAANFNLKKCYSGPLSISKDKYKDLMKLCQTGIIPKSHHNFYNGLSYE